MIAMFKLFYNTIAACQRLVGPLLSNKCMYVCMYLEIVVNASLSIGPIASRRLEVEPLKRDSDGAALWLTNDVHTFPVVWIRRRKVWRRYVAGLLDVNSAASLQTKKNNISMLLRCRKMCCSYFVRLKLCRLLRE